MTVRPIIFSAPMVKALLAGTKTQTRRLISTRESMRKPNLFDGSWSDSYVLDPGNKEWRDSIVRYRDSDLLWVREAFCGPVLAAEGGSLVERIIYRATEPDWVDHRGDQGKWCPSIFMPRWASRLTLDVTNVKIQRLQEISEEDARAEGIDVTTYYREDHPLSICFSVLWDALHGAEAWNANPWVVALTFVAHHCNVDQMKVAA